MGVLFTLPVIVLFAIIVLFFVIERRFPDVITRFEEALLAILISASLALAPQLLDAPISRALIAFSN